MTFIVPDISTAVMLAVTATSALFDKPLVVADEVISAVDFGAANTFTIAAHGLITGDGPIRLTTTGTLPAGVTTGVDYWVVAVDANTIQLTTSRANAVADSPTLINITDAGTGVHTLVDTATTVRVQLYPPQTSKSVFFECVATTNMWLKQGALPSVAASAASGSLYVPAGKTVYVDPARGRYLAAIRDSADGKATLTRVHFEP